MLRGDPADGSFTAFYLLGSRLLAVDAINSPKEFMLGKRLIMQRAEPSPEQLANPAADLAELVKR